MVTIYSGKGGVGRTTLCVNLASVLAAEFHHRVVAVDMDLQYGDLATVVNTAEDHASIADLAGSPAEDLDADLAATAMIDGPGGFRIIPAPPRPELSELVTPAHVTNLLSALRPGYDVILVDCGCYLSDAATAVTDTADLVLLVASPTTPSLKSLRLAKDLLFELGLPGEHIQVVLNHPDEHSDYSDDEVEQHLGQPVIANIPHDSRTAVTALDTGEPFVFTRPRAPIATAVRKLASDLTGSMPAAGVPRGLMSLLSGRSA